MTELILQPDSPTLAHFLEETAVVDWQTPRVRERARRLSEAAADDAARLGAAFAFVRDEIGAPEPDDGRPACSAGEVLREGRGLSFAQAHLLVALLRALGLPAGFAYQRVHDADERPVLYGLAAGRLGDDWHLLDATGASPIEGATPVELDLDGPPGAPRLAHTVDAERGQLVFPTLFSKPSRRVLDLLQRTPDLRRVLAHRPAAP